MIELIEGLPDNVVAAVASGKVSGEDYENVLIPAIESVLETHDKVHFLYQLGPDFESYKGAAMWDDARVGMKHFGKWEKIAVVTDVEWIARSVKAFGFLMPGEVQVFDNDQLEQAKAWVAD